MAESYKNGGAVSDINEELLIKFHEVIESPAPDGKQKEQAVQNFLEENTELIPTPNRLNHQLHFEAILSKFPLGTELITDYVYITKSSDVWRITLVELESPEKEIFTGDKRRAIFSSQFNAAVAQVRNWKIFLDENREEFLRRIRPMLRPLGMANNPVEFHFQLIIGRSENKNLTQDRRKHFRRFLNEAGIDILTYDQLCDWYKNDRRFKKIVMRLTGTGFSIKHMPILPNQILSYMGPDCLFLTKEEITRLESAGYEMEKWLKGELLVYNTRYALSTAEQEMKDGTFYNFQRIAKN
jgi:hypothetical protein